MATKTASYPPLKVAASTRKKLVNAAVDITKQVGTRALASSSSASGRSLRLPDATNTGLPSASIDVARFIQDLETSGVVGLSTYNPGGPNNNCVFVTVAYLMGLSSVDALNEQIKAHFPGSSDDGYDMNMMEELLRLTGHQFRWDYWKGKDTIILAELARECGRRETDLCTEWDIDQLGIVYGYKNNDPTRTGYVDPEQTMHCIVLKDTISGMDADGHRSVMPGAVHEYMDYQYDSDGAIGGVRSEEAEAVSL